MWDFSIQTDHVIEAWKPDKQRTYEIIDFVVPGHSRIKKEKEKTEKHQDLRRKLRKISNVRVKIIS